MVGLGESIEWFRVGEMVFGSLQKLLPGSLSFGKARVEVLLR